MNPFAYAIIQQTLAYFVVLLLMFLILSLVQRGFFWKFMRVKTSFGRLILVKIRSAIRDYYKVGHIEEGFLVYKAKKGFKRLALNENSKKAFYRSIGCIWVDVDEEKNAIVMPDYTTASGYDAEKFSDLYTRALYKPSIMESKEKLILLGLIIIIIALGVMIFFTYKQFNMIGIIKAQVNNIVSGGVSPG